MERRLEGVCSVGGNGEGGKEVRHVSTVIIQSHVGGPQTPSEKTHWGRYSSASPNQSHWELVGNTGAWASSEL